MQSCKLAHFHKREIVIKTPKYLILKIINQITFNGENFQNNK